MPRAPRDSVARRPAEGMGTVRAVMFGNPVPAELREEHAGRPPTHPAGPHHLPRPRVPSSKYAAPRTRRAPRGVTGVPPPQPRRSSRLTPSLDSAQVAEAGLVDAVRGSADAGGGCTSSWVATAGRQLQDDPSGAGYRRVRASGAAAGTAWHLSVPHSGCPHRDDRRLLALQVASSHRRERLGSRALSVSCTPPPLPALAARPPSALGV